MVDDSEPDVCHSEMIFGFLFCLPHYSPGADLVQWLMTILDIDQGKNLLSIFIYSFADISIYSLHFDRTQECRKFIVQPQMEELASLLDHLCFIMHHEFEGALHQFHDFSTV